VVRPGSIRRSLAAACTPEPLHPLRAWRGPCRGPGVRTPRRIALILDPAASEGDLIRRDGSRDRGEDRRSSLRIDLSVPIHPAASGTTLAETASPGSGGAVISRRSAARAVTDRRPEAVLLPSWRSRARIDLIGGGRALYGYNRFANTLPHAGASWIRAAHRRRRGRGSARVLLAFGYSEGHLQPSPRRPNSDLFYELVTVTVRDRLM